LFGICILVIDYSFLIPACPGQVYSNMSIDIGIIGLPQSGKSTIFDGLTRGKVDTSGRSHKGMEAHIGVTAVPEPRMDTLANILFPQKVVSVEAKYIDLGATLRSLVEDKGIGGKLLNELSNVDEMINVVRSFANDSVPHVDGSIDVDRDITSMNLELAFSDLAIIERRLKKIETALKGAKQAERSGYLHEQSLLMKLKALLENEVPIRELQLSEDEAKAISSYQFLTEKPLLIVVNIGENEIARADTLEAELNEKYAQPKRRVVALCGELEMEMAQLDDASADEFRAEYGIKESGLDRVVKTSYELLGLITFFTIASNEVRAWSIPGGTTALKAAGKIHSDMERGFIKAEVISLDDMVKSGNIAEARKQGLLRQEGKTYEVQDGDVITFMFNV
jgi:GTP-binding protein YchF